MPWVPLPNPSRAEHSSVVRVFAKKARFLVDENLGTAVAAILRHLGFKAKSAIEVGLAHRSDEDLYAYAWRYGHIIITQDRDFLDDRRFPPTRNPGVVVLPNVSTNSDAFARSLRAVLTLIGPLARFWRGSKLSIAEDGTISVTNRSHDTGAMETARYRFTNRAESEIWEDDGD